MGFRSAALLGMLTSVAGTTWLMFGAGQCKATLPPNHLLLFNQPGYNDVYPSATIMGGSQTLEQCKEFFMLFYNARAHDVMAPVPRGIQYNSDVGGSCKVLFDRSDISLMVTSTSTCDFRSTSSVACTFTTAFTTAWTMGFNNENIRLWISGWGDGELYGMAPVNANQCYTYGGGAPSGAAGAGASDTNALPKTGDTYQETNYNTGVGNTVDNDFRGDNTEATGYGATGRSSLQTTVQTLSAPTAFTGVPYSNATTKTGAFASANSVYSNAAWYTMGYTKIGNGVCQSAGPVTATTIAGGSGALTAEPGTTDTTSQVDACATLCSAQSTCTAMGATSNVCTLYTGVIVDSGAPTSGNSCYIRTFDRTEITDNTDDGSADHKSGCSGKGFVCDFREVSKMGDYKPADFIWKVVDPRQRYDKEDASGAGLTDDQGSTYNQQTLSCEVKITHNDADGSEDSNWFYVPTGQDNVGSTKYCDIEAIRRDFMDDELYMNDTIHIRGETARINNMGNTEMDLVGEFFDVICGCMTKLSTEATLMDGLKQAQNALLTVMSSTGQEREMGVQMLLFSDDALTNEIVFPQTFPDDSQYMFFVARHLLDNDWDAKLQINTCQACDMADDCSTKGTPSSDEVIFYQGCDTILGGPNEIMISSSSWFKDSATTPPTLKDGTNMKPNGRWADDDKDTCPYAAKGFQKFRLANRESMQITCAVTACESLPCVPCKPRRSLSQMLGVDASSARRLQAGGNEVDVTMYMRILGGAPVFGGNGDNSSSSSKKRGIVFTCLIVLIVLCVLAAAYIATRKAAQRGEANKGRTVVVVREVPMKEATTA